MNWAETTKAKSDQLNAVDLITGEMTITITKVKVVNNPDQPAIIYYEGDNGKPYKPSKTMRRLIAVKWGDDESQFVGRSLTLFCNPAIRFGPNEVGGIQISHMSHMESEKRHMLMVARNKYEAFKPLHLVIEKPKPKKSPEEAASDWVEKSMTEINKFNSAEELNAWLEKNDGTITKLEKYEQLSTRFSNFCLDAQDSFAEPEAEG